jgi:hypothetical protein
VFSVLKNSAWASVLVFALFCKGWSAVEKVPSFASVSLQLLAVALFLEKSVIEPLSP